MHYINTQFNFVLVIVFLCLKKEGNVIFNNTLNTFKKQLCGIGYVVFRFRSIHIVRKETCMRYSF